MRGHAYVVNEQGRLIAHPDISLVLRNTDMSQLAQVRAASGDAAGTTSEPVQMAQNIQGHQVLTAYARVMPLGWLVFVELPIAEARMRRSMRFGSGQPGAAGGARCCRTGRDVPGEAYGRSDSPGFAAGAARIGSGDLAQHIAIKTGDELEASPISSTTAGPSVAGVACWSGRQGRAAHPELRAALEQNARLFQEIEEKGKQLEAANLRMRAELDFVGQRQQVGATHAGRTRRH